MDLCKNTLKADLFVEACHRNFLSTALDMEAYVCQVVVLEQSATQMAGDYPSFEDSEAPPLLSDSSSDLDDLNICLESVTTFSVRFV